jgi:hypothetical protein
MCAKTGLLGVYTIEYNYFISIGDTEIRTHRIGLSIGLGKHTKAFVKQGAVGADLKNTLTEDCHGLGLTRLQATIFLREVENIRLSTYAACSDDRLPNESEALKLEKLDLEVTRSWIRKSSTRFRAFRSFCT